LQPGPLVGAVGRVAAVRYEPFEPGGPPRLSGDLEMMRAERHGDVGKLGIAETLVARPVKWKMD